ncbi:MAG: hypothetical protein QOJ99_2649 [Bryobacterales bacterium]|jgi:nucleoside-diphosphate-sugar epimerase|nr:hypothetical protein [Bryobacterales bacterium]
MVTLLGAAGAVGRSISDALNQQATPYRVVGRDRAALTKSFGHDKLAEITTWDPDNPAAARAALHGSDTIVYLIGVPYHQFHLHPIVMKQTLDAAIAEGVQRILLIGTVYPYGKPITTPVTEQHPRQPHTYKGKMRKQAEDLLLQAEAGGKLRATILRLPDFYGPNVEKSFLDSLFKAAATGGTANMLGPVDPPHEFVFIPDVGPVVTALLQTEGAWGHMWNLAGAGAMTQREIAERVFRMAGTKPRIRVAGKNLLRLMGLFNPLLREMVEMHYLLTTPVLLDDSALHKLLGTIHKTPYDEGLRLSLEAARAASPKPAH